MATCNGVSHLGEQIASIQAQTYDDWVLLVSDDQSTDGTLELLGELAESDTRIKLLQSSVDAPRGAAANFSRLMQAGLQHGGNLFFFCDQDDVWEQHKLERQVSEFPQQGGERTPLLVHSDLSVVDSDLAQIHPSLIGYMALEPSPSRPLHYLLTRNFVTGCASACNRSLLETAVPVSSQAIMHDWWLALVAAATGEITYIASPLVKYRQHGGNSIGAKGFWHGLNPTNNWVSGWRAGNEEFLATFCQVRALYSHALEAGNCWPDDNVVLLQDYSCLLDSTSVSRLALAHRMGLRQGNKLLQAIYYLRLLTVQDK